MRWWIIGVALLAGAAGCGYGPRDVERYGSFDEGAPVGAAPAVPTEPGGSSNPPPSAGAGLDPFEREP